MLIGLVPLSSLEMSKFTFPFFYSHLLEGIRSNQVGELFSVSFPTKRFELEGVPEVGGTKGGLLSLVLMLAS
jgi:hypothetical protein